MPEPTYVPPAHQTAAFDQTYAEGQRVLDNLVGLYRRTRSGNHATREVDIAGFSGWMQQFYDRSELADLMANAVVRLVERYGEVGRDAADEETDSA